jgi:hypothetical protein
VRKRMATPMTTPAVEAALEQLAWPGHVQGSVALSVCTTVHPLHTRVANMLGASISKVATRPNLRRAPAANSERAAPADVAEFHAHLQQLCGAAPDPGAPRGISDCHPVKGRQNNRIYR